MQETIPVPPALRRRLWYGVIGSGVFMIVVFLEGWQRPGYDTMQQALSALSLGSRGWIQAINFVVFGTVVLSTVTAWRKILAGRRRANAIPVLLTLTGISLILCGFIQQDPAPGYDPEGLALKVPTLRGSLHLLLAAVIALSSVLVLLIMSRYFYSDPQWYGWSVYSIVMAVVMITCVTIYGIWSTASTGYAGLFERVATIIVPLWSVSFLMRLEAGVPFMVSVKSKTTL